MALLAERHRDWGCLLVLLPQTSNVSRGWGVLPVSSISSIPKMRMSPDSSHPERASLKAFAQPHLPMALLAQRHRDWGCLLVLPTSNLKYRSGGLCRGSPAVLLRKCKHLQVAGSQKDLAWIAVAQPHLPMSLLAQRHRDWGCLLVLLPQTSNIHLAFCAGGLRQPCSENANVCR